jgi:hypothetical protein
MNPAFAESQSLIISLSLPDCAFAEFAKNSTEENNNDRMMSVISIFFHFNVV